MQSETEIAVLNTRGSMGKKMVVGYNDSMGFYNSLEGLSGYAYSTNGGNTWIDGGGLPPRIRSGAPAGTPGQDAYFGDPVVVVHHQTETFYYSSIYQSNAGYLTLVVNRGVFAGAPPPGTLPNVVQSRSDTRCLNHPELFGVANEPTNQKEQLYWYPPVEVVVPPGPTDTAFNDLLDKEWLYVDQTTGTLYVTYTRFENAPTFGTPIELVRCRKCAFKPAITTADWEGPFVIVPNEDFDFNQATQPITTPSGRVIVTWIARRFNNEPPFQEIENHIEYAYSDDDGTTFTLERDVAQVNPQGEPPGYNRGRTSILNAPYINVDKGEDDGIHTPRERTRPGFGNVYITYFSGKTPLPLPPTGFGRAGDILLSVSEDDGGNFGPPTKVNDDPGVTSHVFPSVQANKHGDVYVTWLDRRYDPANRLTNTWAAVSRNLGLTFGHNKVQSDVATDWFTREDSSPDYGDYNSSELLGFNQFVITWADGRFPPGTVLIPQAPPAPPVIRRAATPDTIFTIAQGLGNGNP